MHFVNPQEGDFRLQNGSVALSVGFKNFALDSFGVISPRLKALAKKVQMPVYIALSKVREDEIIDFMGAKIKNLTTLGERSATGMDDARGVLVIEVVAGSGASRFLQANDVILAINDKNINKIHDLLEARMSVIGTNTEIIVFRNQKEMKKRVELDDKK